MNQIASIQASKFACFDHLTPDVRNEQIKSLFYIERMAGVSNTDISKIDIFDVFGRKDADKALLVTSKGEINRRLLVLSQNAPAPEPAKDLSDAQISAINAMNTAFMKRQNNRLEELRKNKASNMNYVDSHTQNANEYMRRAWETEIEIQRITGHTPNFKQAFEKIQTDGFWEFLEATNDGVSFITRSEIVMGYRNKAADLDVQVNMGKYKAVYNARNNSVVVLAYERNPYASNSYYHPYVNSVGSICFGTAASTANKLLAGLQLPEFFELLAALLGTYDPTSTPYQSLDTFAEAAKAGIYERKAPCAYCGHIKGECGCHECPKCLTTRPTRCSRHWCKICETYNNYDCECCTECQTQSSEEHEEFCSQWPGNRQEEEESEPEELSATPSESNEEDEGTPF